MSFDSRLGLKKREKIILTALILSLGLFLSKFVPFFFKLHYIIAMTLLSYILSLWALWEGINKLKAVVLMILPTLFTLAVSAGFLLLLTWWVKALIILGFGVMFYTLLLSQNIFNVSSTRTIPLYRVAFTVAFIITVTTAAQLFNDVFSLNLLFVWNGLIVFFLTFVLALQVFWSIEMESLNKLIIIYSVVVALVVAETTLTLSFWPISKPLASVVVAESFFITLAISVDSQRERLSRGVVGWYLTLGIAVFTIAFMLTSWAG